MRPLFLLLSYLLGSVPSGILVARALGLGDPRSIGSGNIGAANLTRLGGKRVGIATFVLDFLKGALPVLLAKLYFPDQPVISAFCGLLAVAGHCYSVFLLFRGGKGVATTAGAFLALAPIPMMAALFAWALAFYVFRTTSLAAMVALPVLLCALMAAGAPTLILGAALACSLMVVRRHKANLFDLVDGKERAFGGKAAN